MADAESIATLEEILSPLDACLDVQVARALVGLRASEKAQVRIDELADKANEGQLSEKERAEYETYIAAGNFVGVLQAKARRWLAAQTE